jgi:hypothetical protein
MPLHIPQNDTGELAYCAPTAIMAITGQPLSMVHPVIRGGFKASGRVWWKPITSVPNFVTLAAMKYFGWFVVEKDTIPPGHHMLLQDLLYSLSPKPGPYIIHVTGHVLAVGDGKVCNSLSRVPISRVDYLMRPSVKPNWWVRDWWRFEQGEHNE